MAGDPTKARTVAELVSAVRSGARPKFVFFWSHRPNADGHIGPSCLSQWWPARFVADGHTFGSAEQYMMWRKATLFGDGARAEAILQSRSAAQAKAMGRQVTGFDEAVWTGSRFGVVVAGSVAKFDSDPALRAFLLGTRNRVLAEASPADRVWGIGLAADSDHAANPQQWRGQNLLGFALMEARHLLDG